MLAQNDGYLYKGLWYTKNYSVNPSIFYLSPAGKPRVSFRFLGLNNNAANFTLELNNILQLNYLPNLDSILDIVKLNLERLTDSLKEDGITRRIDYNTANFISNKNDLIRITNYDTRPKQYVITKNDITELKTEQDTLRIRCFAPTSDSTRVNIPIGIDQNGNFSKKMKSVYLKSPVPSSLPFFITITVNNIADIHSFDPGVLEKCITLLRKEVTQEYINKASPIGFYGAYFDIKSNKMLSPASAKWINHPNGNYAQFVPNIYAGMSFARGNFIPSVSLGFRYTFAGGEFATRSLYLMYEPHFLFSRDNNNKLITDNNDFLTIRYMNVLKNKKDGFDFVGNVSLGYLVNRNGIWFEPNTWKFGIPAVRSGWLQLEPEFFFTGFFKNASPSLRLTIHYE